MDKLETLLDMVEHPHLYTEQQVKTLLDDEDMRKHYDTMVALRMACHASHTNHGSKNINHHPSIFRKIAAIFLGLIFMGGLAFAAYHFYKGYGRITKNEEPAKTIAHQPGTSAATFHPSCPAIHFENTRIDSLLTIVSANYHCTLVFSDDAPHHLRITTTWQPQEPLPVFIERMNELDGLYLTTCHDTMLVSQSSDNQ